MSKYISIYLDALMMAAYANNKDAPSFPAMLSLSHAPNPR